MGIPNTAQILNTSAVSHAAHAIPTKYKLPTLQRQKFLKPSLHLSVSEEYDGSRSIFQGVWLFNVDIASSLIFQSTQKSNSPFEMYLRFLPFLFHRKDACYPGKFCIK